MGTKQLGKSIESCNNLVVCVVSLFKCYLYGSPFMLIRNHWPLKFDRIK
jgi:hypothetical protein